MNTTDNTAEVPVLNGTLEGGVAIPEKQYDDTAGKIVAKTQDKMTKRNMEAIKQANRALALDKVNAESLVNLNLQIAYSDDTDERWSAQERTQARKWLQDMAFASDSQVKGDSGAITINIRGIGEDVLKDVVSTEDGDS